ncbi:MAG: hypothetical protein QOJ99_6235, partial [Bryobacterales bacterium]|nr:hypothetical protein [Bryobacterales bacterium]
GMTTRSLAIDRVLREALQFCDREA